MNLPVLFFLSIAPFVFDPAFSWRPPKSHADGSESIEKPSDQDRIENLSRFLGAIPLVYECPPAKADYEEEQKKAVELALIPGHARHQLQLIQRALSRCQAAVTESEKKVTATELQTLFWKCHLVLSRLPTSETVDVLRSLIRMLPALEKASEAFPSGYQLSARDAIQISTSNVLGPPERIIRSISGDTWRSLWMNLAEQENSMTIDEKLSLYECGLALGEQTSLTKEEAEVYHHVRSAILKTPGYADYYIERIHRVFTEYRRHPQETDIKEGLTLADLRALEIKGFFQRELSLSLRSLTHLPGHETVRGVGELLAYPLTCYQAARTLELLPLRNKPTTSKIHSPDDGQAIQEWINWYTSIKEGRRTFSFEGDPNEYDLNGPIHKAKNPDIPRAAKRPPIAGNASTDSQNGSKSSPASWIAGVIVAILAGVSWIVLKRRKAI